MAPDFPAFDPLYQRRQRRPVIAGDTFPQAAPQSLQQILLLPVVRSSDMHRQLVPAASFLQFLHEPLIGELVQFADFVHLGQIGLLDQRELAAGVHHLQLRLGVCGGHANRGDDVIVMSHDRRCRLWQKGG